jgi:hypothetical protein
MEKVYYQPEWYKDDGTCITYGDIPDELYSFQAFPSKEICEDWLYQHDYDPADFIVNEYHDDDIEDVQLIDEYGDDYEL